MDKNELKMAALRDEIVNLTDRVAGLRADLTIVSNEKQAVDAEAEGLRARVQELEEQQNVEQQEDTATEDE